MRTTWFFRAIWRVNAVLILVAGLLAVVILAFGVFRIASDVFRQRHVHAIVNVEQDGNVKENLSVVAGPHVHGGTHLLVALQSDQEYQQAYFSKSAHAIRNYAFVSLKGEATWIYPHNNFLFYEAVPLRQDLYDAQPVRAVLFVVRKEDSDGDQRLTDRDAGVIAFSKPDGTGFKEVISEVVKLVSYRIAEESMMLVYETVRGPATAVVDLEDFSVIQSSPLPVF